MGLIARERLTKSFLMSRRTGTYLVSNRFIHRCPRRPRFAERVTAPEKLEAQWQRIVAAGVSGRLCNNYACSHDHGRWIAAIQWQ